MNNELQFYTSIGLIDIWIEQNTKSGTVRYTFWYNGRTYEADNPAEIIRMANGFNQRTR